MRMCRNRSPQTSLDMWTPELDLHWLILLLVGFMTFFDYGFLVWFIVRLDGTATSTPAFIHLENREGGGWVGGSRCNVGTYSGNIRKAATWGGGRFSVSSGTLHCAHVGVEGAPSWSREIPGTGGWSCPGCCPSVAIRREMDYNCGYEIFMYLDVSLSKWF